MEDMINRLNYYLPPFCHFTPEEWDRLKDENGYIQLAWAIKFSSTQLKFYGLPNIEGCYAHLYDKTALRFIWMEENDTIITVDPNHTYDVYLDILTSVPVGTTGTYYPMLYDARLNPSGYVPYTMTNRELAKKQMKSLSSYVDLTTDADGDAYSDTLSSLYPDKVVMGCIIDYNYYKPYAPTRAGYTFYFGDRINIRGGSSQPNMEFRVHYTLLYHDRY